MPRIPLAAALALALGSLLLAGPQAFGQAGPPPALVIEGDAQLDAAHGVVAGSGTASDPFVLQLPEGTKRLEVRDTTAHLRIDTPQLGSLQGLEFFGAGILLVNVRDVEIANPTLIGFQQGIAVGRSSNVTIHGGAFLAQIFYGIQAEDVEDFEVSGATFNRTQKAGAYLRDMHDVRVANNTFDHAGHNRARESSSLRVESSEGVVVRDNRILESDSTGILFDNVEDFLIAANRVTDHLTNGIWVDESDDGEVVGNVAQGNDLSGIYLCTGFGMSATGNLLHDNGVGLDLAHVNGITLSDNNVTASRDHGFNLVATEASLVTGNHFADHGSAKPVIRVDGSNNRFLNNTGAGNVGQFVRVVAGSNNVWDGAVLPVEPEPTTAEPADGPGGGGLEGRTVLYASLLVGAVVAVFGVRRLIGKKD